MRQINFFARASLLTFMLAGSSFAAGDILLRVDSSNINSIARQYGLKIAKQLKGNGGVYAVNVPNGASAAAVAQSLRSNSLVQNAEANSSVDLPKRAGAAQWPSNSKNNCAATALVTGKYRYTSQASVATICLVNAQKKYGGGSSGVHVAIIDTAIDYQHPVLSPVMDPGFDVINNVNGPFGVSQETSPFVDQETSPFVDSAGNYVVNQETSPFVDQETSPFVDQETSPFVDGIPPAYGHGTMVAGIVHLVAPNVRIVPVRAFNDNGSANMADVIQAIYWAVDNGADVINMSFSAPQYSPELDNAIQYAIAHSVVCVASVSNSGSPSPVYPAALKNSIGVGATDNSDIAASFSDYGNDVVVAAPGVWIYSTYPDNAYAYSSGTSFSTPFVAGTVALIKSLNRNASPASATSYLQFGADSATGFLSGAGRLDVLNSDKLVK